MYNLEILWRVEGDDHTNGNAGDRLLNQCLCLAEAASYSTRSLDYKARALAAKAGGVDDRGLKVRAFLAKRTSQAFEQAADSGMSLLEVQDELSYDIALLGLDDDAKLPQDVVNIALAGERIVPIKGQWIFEDIVVDTAVAFAKKALPDSRLAQWSAGKFSYKLYYEICDTVPDAWGHQAFRIIVYVDQGVPTKQNAEVSFTIEDPIDGEPYVRDLGALREGFTDPKETLEWNEEEGLWETAVFDDDDETA